MPFKSRSQMKACFAKKERGQAKGWNCEEWAHATPSIKSLPEHKKEASFAIELGKIAADLSKDSNRQKVPKGDFVFKNKAPKGEKKKDAKGKYPIPDKVHARAAEGFCAMHHGSGSSECKAVRAKVNAKFGKAACDMVPVQKPKPKAKVTLRKKK